MSNSISLKELMGNQQINEEMMDSMTTKMDANAIPDLDKILLHIGDLLKDIETPEMQKLEKENVKEFEKIIVHKYIDRINSLRIINLMLEPQRYANLDRLLDMFEKLENVKAGKSNIDDAHKKWCEKMNSEYIYPKYGSKEEFERQLKK